MSAQHQEVDQEILKMKAEAEQEVDLQQNQQKTQVNHQNPNDIVADDSLDVQFRIYFKYHQ